MTVNKNKLLINKLLKRIGELDFTSLIDEELKNKIQISEKIKLISNTKKSFLYTLRYPKPILNKLILDQNISEELYDSFNDIYSFYKIKKENKSNYDSDLYYKEKDAPVGYFKVKIGTWSNRNRNKDKYKRFFEEISSNFDTKESEDKITIFISVNEIYKFLDKYRTIEEIHWYNISSSNNIPWTNDLISKYSETLDWNYLHKNPSITWNFEIIEKNIDKINWSFISSYKYLDWTLDKLVHYKDYLIFSTYKNMSSDIWKKSGKNKSGKLYSINEDDYYKDTYLSKKHYFSDLTGSISLSESVLWTEEVIDCLISYWDWEELSSNIFINWNEELIDKFIEQINFDSLCSNPSIHWSEDLIEKYYNRINWESLSCNPNLPWSFEFIKKYEDKWNWYKLSASKGIKWCSEILNEYEDRVDFWLIALNGKIPEESILKFHEKFDKKQVVDIRNFRFSDWRETGKVYRTGWENLYLNPNFKFSSNFIDFLYKRTTKVTYIDGNLADDGEYVTKEYSILEILKNTPITNLSIDQLISNEFQWGEILYNENHINYTVWTDIIKPLFTNNYIKEYHTFLKFILEENTDT